MSEQVEPHVYCTLSQIHGLNLFSYLAEKTHSDVEDPEKGSQCLCDHTPVGCTGLQQDEVRAEEI